MDGFISRGVQIFFCLLDFGNHRWFSSLIAIFSKSYLEWNKMYISFDCFDLRDFFFHFSLLPGNSEGFLKVCEHLRFLPFLIPSQSLIPLHYQNQFNLEHHKILHILRAADWCHWQYMIIQRTGQQEERQVRDKRIKGKERRNWRRWAKLTTCFHYFPQKLVKPETARFRNSMLIKSNHTYTN